MTLYKCPRTVRKTLILTRTLKIMIIWKGSKSHSTAMLWQVPVMIGMGCITFGLLGEVWPCTMLCAYDFSF